MRFRALAIFTVALLLNTAVLCAGEKPTVTVMPDKVLYSPGETAKFDVTVSNRTKDSVKGTMEIKVIWEMDDCVTIKKEPVEVAPGGKKTIFAEWKTADVLGCEVRVDLTDGTNLIATGAEYFNVCPAKEVQRIGIHIGANPDLFTWPGKDYLASIPQQVAVLRQSYANIVEYFDWSPGQFADITPQQDVWCSQYWQSKAALQTAVAEEHKHGLKVLQYLISLATSPPGAELVRLHPEWFLYRENGQLWTFDCDVAKLNFQRNPDLRAGTCFDIGWALSACPNFSLKEPLEYGVQQMIASKKMFHWDGVRFDGQMVMFNTEVIPGTVGCPDARDDTGKVVVSGEKGKAITRANTDYTRRTISAVFPDYLFMFNSSTQECDIAQICRDGGATANEITSDSLEVKSPLNAWKVFTQSLLDDVAVARKNSGYAYAEMNPPWRVCLNVDRIQFPLLFASGDHPWFACPELDRTYDKGGTHYPIQKDYFRFATRFSAALWGRGIERVKSPEDVVDVSAPQGSVWWKEFVQRRPLADGRQQLVVHLVNEPPTPNIEADTQPLPSPVKDITVKFKQPVTRVWLATSQPELSYRQLPVDNGTVKVPELRIWSMVIAETGGK